MDNILFDKFNKNTPILIDDIKNLYSNYSRPMIFKMIEKWVEDGELVRYDVGVYYIPTKTVFGTSTLNVRKVVEKKYISDGNEIYGFYSGVSFANIIGITQQVPNIIEVMTNNETTRVRNVEIGSQNIRLRRARTFINKDNYKELQLLELFNTLSKDEIEENKKYINQYIVDNGITEKDISKYALNYPAKAIKNYILNGV